MRERERRFRPQKLEQNNKTNDDNNTKNTNIKI